MTLQTPLGKFLGKGSAGHGAGHWWSQRLTAVALLPLTLWFAVALLTMNSFAYADIAAWVAEPFHAIGLAALIIALLYHSQLGLQVVVEDYVHTGWLKVSTLIGLKLAHAGLGIAGLYAVILIASRTMP